MFNSPYSMHRLFNISSYGPGGLVLGTKHGIAWDEMMFAKGERPEAIIDYPIHITDMESIDLFNWQEQAKGMLSLMELTRRINVRGKQIRRLLRENKITPDLSVPIGNKRSFDYFKPERVSEICKKFGWTEITNANRKEIFIENIRRMQMDHSYKPVFLMSFFDHMDEEGTARLEDVVTSFKDFYDDRVERNLIVEKQSSIFNTEGYTEKDAERLMLSMPFKVYEEMGVMSHSKYIGVIQLDKQIAKRLNQEDIAEIITLCKQGLVKYYGAE